MKVEFHKSYLSFLTFTILSLMSALIMSVPDANAYERYNDGCVNCHGSFSGDTSPKGSSFGNHNKMDMHRDSDFMDSDCNLCHVAGSKGRSG